MNIRNLVCIFVSVLCVIPAQFSKILAIFPMPSRSHYIFAETLLKKLAERGHELTVVGVYPQKTPVRNFRDIIIEDNINGIDEFTKNTAKGQTGITFKIIVEFMALNNFLTVNVLEHKEFKKLLNSPEGKFDLIINEVIWVNAFCGLGEVFKAPMIAVSPFGCGTINDETVGNISPNSIVPNTILPYGNRMTFFQRLHSFLTTVVDEIIFEIYNNRRQAQVYHKYFPNATLSFKEARSSYSLLLVNQHPSVSFPRPYVSNAIEVGGLHIPFNPDPLPADMQKFVDNATEGVIYFTMGSNLKSRDFDVEKLNIFLNVFRSLKQKVLWKFENSHLANKPDNVFISAWCPQFAVLKHPNVKVFITHGGLLSTTEAIFYGKPMLGIPMMAEQPRNVAFSVNRGIALSIDFHKLNEVDLKNKLHELIYNPKYKKNTEDISRQFHDKPTTALETAIFWVEYVLRHKGAKHLESATIHLNLLQYYSVDVVATVLLVIIFITYLLFLIFRKIIHLFLSYKADRKNSLKKFN